MSTIHQQGGKWYVFKLWPLSRLTQGFSTMAQAVGAQEKLNAVQPRGEQMSLKTTLAEILGFTLLAGEQLTPVYIHNPRSQAIATILTPDINALFTLLTQQGAMAAQTAAAPPAA